MRLLIACVLLLCLYIPAHAQKSIFRKNDTLFCPQNDRKIVYKDLKKNFRVTVIKNVSDSLDVLVVIRNDSKYTMGIAYTMEKLSRYSDDTKKGGIYLGYNINAGKQGLPQQMEMPMLLPGRADTVMLQYKKCLEYEVSLLLCTDMDALVKKISDAKKYHEIKTYGNEKVLYIDEFDSMAGNFVDVCIENMSNDASVYKYVKVYPFYR